jgi:hypothetical protein
MTKSKIVVALLFVATFFLTVKYVDDSKSLTSLRWGTTLDVAQAREK